MGLPGVELRRGRAVLLLEALGEPVSQPFQHLQAPEFLGWWPLPSSPQPVGRLSEPALSTAPSSDFSPLPLHP